MGPRRKFLSISTQRNTEANATLKPKKIEDVATILNRVVRADCCLLP